LLIGYKTKALTF